MEQYRRHSLAGLLSMHLNSTVFDQLIGPNNGALDVRGMMNNYHAFGDDIDMFGADEALGSCKQHKETLWLAR